MGGLLRISQFYKKNDLVISFELFPPKTPAGENKLFKQTIEGMLKLSPSFLTCTYGAGGSARRTTLRIVAKLQQEMGIETVAHLSCAGLSRDQLTAFLESAGRCGISNILAVRGDAAEGDKQFAGHPEGLRYAHELVAFIKSHGGFDVAIAGYPEGHPECPDKYLDWRRCRDKVEAGGDVIITQLFYENDDFFGFEDYLKNKLGVTVPIVPGVLPIVSLSQIRRICGLCGANLPGQVVRRLEELGDDDEAVRRYGVELAVKQCDELIRAGVPGIHFYTLNRTKSTYEVIHSLGL
ncbi:MAG: methylenetetrahydrofolate reductase [NAD(P)H] [Planctomycetota bacterium]